MNAPHSRQQRAGQAGFTLVELLAVVIIIGVLAAVAIPAYNHYIKQARTTEATTLLPQIKLKVEAYRLEMRQIIPASFNPPSSEWSKMSQGTQGTWTTNMAGWTSYGFTPPTPGLYFQYFVNTSNQVPSTAIGAVTTAGVGNQNSCFGLIDAGAHYPTGSGDQWYTVCARGSFLGRTEANAEMVFGLSSSPTLQRVFSKLDR